MLMCSQMLLFYGLPRLLAFSCTVPGRTIVYCLKTMARYASSACTLQSYQSGGGGYLMCVFVVICIL